MKLTTLILLILLSADCVACRVAPREQLISTDALVANSSNVVLAKVIKTTPDDNGEIRYFFTVVKRFSGDEQADMQIMGHATTFTAPNQTFGDHFDDAFWHEGGGRVSSDTDCKIHPSFVLGRTYLIFLDQTYTKRSFELIRNTQGDAKTKDKWLQFVEQRLNPIHAQPNKH
jgi:hypothetical protein